MTFTLPIILRNAFVSGLSEGFASLVMGSSEEIKVILLNWDRENTEDRRQSRSENHSSDSVKQVGFGAPKRVCFGLIVVAYQTLQMRALQGNIIGLY